MLDFFKHLPVEMLASLSELTVELVYLLLAVFVLLLGKLTLNLLTPFKLDDELTAKDNPAFGLSIAGYYIGILIIMTGASAGQFGADQHWNLSLLKEIGLDLCWAIGGIVLLNAARIVTDNAFVFANLHRAVAHAALDTWIAGVGGSRALFVPFR